MRLILVICLLIGYSGYSQVMTDTLPAFHHYSRSIAFTKAEKKDSAIQHLYKAIEIYGRASAWKRQAQCYNLISRYYFKLSQFSQAILVARAVLAMAPGKLPDNRIEIGRAWVNIGNSYVYKSDNDSAFYAYQKATPIYESLLSENNPELGTFYLSISQVYFYKADYERSISYRLKALAIFTKAYGSKHLEVARAHQSIASTYIMMQEYSPALKHLSNVIDICKSHPNESGLLLQFNYNRMAEIYRVNDDYKKSLHYLKESISLKKKENTPFDVVNYRDLGNIYGKLGQFELALNSFDKALVIAKGMFGERHPACASIYQLRGTVLLQKGLYDKALLDFQKSFVSNSKRFDDLHPYALPLSHDIVSYEETLPLSIDKAQALLERYDKEKREGDLQASLKTFQLADTLLFTGKLSRLTQADKLRFGKFNINLYEGAIMTCLKLYEVTHEKHYQEQAFYFSERNKSMTLAEMLSEAVIKNTGIVPKELLNFQNKLNDEITSLQSQIQEAKAHQKDPVPLEGKLFTLNLRADSIMAKLEHDYPRYYQSKYKQSNAIEVNELQKVIPNQTTMLEYFEGNKNVYLFFISNKSYEVRSIAKTDLYDSLLIEFGRSTNTARIEEIHSEKSYNRFVHASCELFKLLMKEAFVREDREVPTRKLIIVPDGRLCYLPFEILLTDQPTPSTGDYTSLKYLLKKYAVSYGYSAALYFKNNIEQANIDHASGKGLLAFAPRYDSNKPNSLQADLPDQFRNATGELKWNQHEVERINQVFKGDDYLAGEATEGRFKQLAPRYDIIHLAMHAWADDDEPMNSALVFAQESDSLEDGLLHAFELYNMKLNARMVVLSGCNTGAGKLAKGEGIMSLGRAFSYAGVPSIVMSHWEVDDETTSILMEYFYDNLSKGMNKSAAMRAAKLMYLENTDVAKMHPFYWAAFVIIGEDDPLPLPASIHTLEIGILGVAILLLAFITFWYLKKKPVKL